MVVGGFGGCWWVGVMEMSVGKVIVIVVTEEGKETVCYSCWER